MCGYVRVDKQGNVPLAQESPSSGTCVQLYPYHTGRLHFKSFVVAMRLCDTHKMRSVVSFEKARTIARIGCMMLKCILIKAFRGSLWYTEQVVTNASRSSWVTLKKPYRIVSGMR